MYYWNGPQSDPRGCVETLCRSLAGKNKLLATRAEEYDKLSARMKAKEKKRAEFSRRRAHREARDVTHINDRNEHFNKKLDRAYGEHTAEIKANLERGTALPDH